MFLRPIALLLILACSARAAGFDNIGAEYFGPGTKAEIISLEQAIEMALQNNLDARFEHVGIAVEEARRRSAAGEFDPVFSATAVRESLRRPQNADDFSSTDQVRQAAQVQAITDETNAINASIPVSSANASANAALAAAQAAQIATQAGAFIQTLTPGGLVTSRGMDLGRVTANLAAATANLTQVANNLSTNTSLVTSSNTFFSDTVFDQENDRVNGSVQGRTPWGMRYGFQVEANRLRNTFSGDIRTVFPEYQTSATVTIIQPILKNFGPAANLADLRIARLNKQAQILGWKQRVSTTIQSVIATYYDMLYAMRDVDVRQAMIDSGQTLLAQNKRRLELGFMSPLDVQQAEVQVSIDREAMITSKGLFMERQFALKRLVLNGLQADDRRVFIPSTAPRLPMPKIDRADFMQTALARRYDYQAALLDAEVQNIRLRFARNQMYPQLDLIGTYGLNGLQGNYGDSFDQGFSGHTPEWTAGVQMQIPFGFVKERAQLNLVKGLQQQSILKIKQTELNVGVDVDTVISRILTNQQRVETARRTRELQEEASRVAGKRLAEGQLSSFELIEQSRKLGDAQSRELAAIAEYNKSISQLWLATGTILDRQGVFFDK